MQEWIKSYVEATLFCVCLGMYTVDLFSANWETGTQ
jgi:hypothetical protein